MSVHTLACCAREIYEQHLRKGGRERTFDMFRGSPVLGKISEKEIWDVLNASRVFFKHPGETVADTIEFSDEQNDLMLLMAANDCTELCADRRIPEAAAVLRWAAATHEAFGPQPDPSPVPGCDGYYANLDATYPGLRTASRAEKKRFGRALFSDGCLIVPRCHPESS